MRIIPDMFGLSHVLNVMNDMAQGLKCLTPECLPVRERRAHESIEEAPPAVPDRIDLANCLVVVGLLLLRGPIAAKRRFVPSKSWRYRADGRLRDRRNVEAGGTHSTDPMNGHPHAVIRRRQAWGWSSLPLARIGLVFRDRREAEAPQQLRLLVQPGRGDSLLRERLMRFHLVRARQGALQTGGHENSAGNPSIHFMNSSKIILTFRRTPNPRSRRPAPCSGPMGEVCRMPIMETFAFETSHCVNAPDTIGVAEEVDEIGLVNAVGKTIHDEFANVRRNGESQWHGE